MLYIYQQPYTPKQEEEKKSNLIYKYLTPKNITIAAIISIILVILSVIYGWSSFKKTNIDFSIIGPKEVSSAEEANFTIFVKNKNRKTLEEVELYFNYPNSFVIKNIDLQYVPFGSNGIKMDLGSLKKNQERQINIKAATGGEKGENKNLITTLKYKPKGLSAIFENKASLSFYIKFVPITLTINAPEKIFSDSEISYLLNYTNSSDQTLQNLKLEAEYPDKFIFKSSTPQPSENDNKWDLAELAPNGQGSILVKGMLSGQANEVKKIIFVLKTETRNDDIILNTIAAEILIKDKIFEIVEEINGSQDYIANIGESINFKLRFKNVSGSDLSNVKVKVGLVGDLFNIKTLQNQDGYFDPLTNSMAWTSVNLPQLETVNQNDTNELSFNIQLKQSIANLNQNTKNPIVKFATVIYTETPPIVFNTDKLEQKTEKIIKIKTKAGLTVKAFYIDPYNNTPNSGPTPPKVGQTTTYTVHWQLTNTTGDLSNNEITTILPLNVKWINNIKTTDGTLYFNPQTNEITWTLTAIPAGTGFYLPIKEAVFQIALTPSILDADKYATLTNKTGLTANEIFVNLPLILEVKILDTRLPDDLSHGGKVQQ